MDHIGPAIYGSSLEVICPLPPASAYLSSTGDTNFTAFGYQISVSNDGVIFSNPADLLLFDSSCNDVQFICGLQTKSMYHKLNIRR